MDHPATPKTQRLRELAHLFLLLGTTAFGGPAAHIAMMEEHVVRRKRWLTHDEFLDLVGAAHLIPGPNSTELAIHIGHRRAGWAGLAVAGLCFILPAALIVVTIAWGYVRYGELPRVQGVLSGVKPVIIAIVLQALGNLGRRALKTKALMAAGIIAIALSLAGVHELVILFGIGLAMIAGRGLIQRNPASNANASHLLGIVPLPVIPFLAAAGIAGAPAFGLGKLFLFFLKVGSVLFGSGYVLLAYLRADLVERWHWLTETQLLDAIAVGQVTPGPVFTTATFIGYVLGGMPGAVVATFGIFLPAFIFVALSGPLVPRLRRSKVAGAFLDGVNVASLALMATVTWQLSAGVLSDWVALVLLAVSLLLLVRFRLNSVWLIAAGAVIGLVRGTS